MAQLLSICMIGFAVVAAEWDAILDVDYWPILGVARRLLNAVDNDDVAAAVLNELYGSASDKVAHRATQGRVGELFGRPIADRKFLATYDARPQSASATLVGDAPAVTASHRSKRSRPFLRWNSARIFVAANSSSA